MDADELSRKSAELNRTLEEGRTPPLEIRHPTTGMEAGQPLVLTTWVVMEARIGSRRVWAWCRLEYGPGFEEINYTNQDGITPAQLDEAPTVLDRFLFSVQVPS